MFDIPQPATALHMFAQDHYDSLQYAALLLGGKSWLRRVQSLLTDLASSQAVTRRIFREGAAVLSLLKLEYTDSIDSCEAAHFASLDLTAPYIAEICLLTEALDAALLGTEAAVVSRVDYTEEKANV